MCTIRTLEPDDRSTRHAVFTDDTCRIATHLIQKYTRCPYRQHPCIATHLIHTHSTVHQWLVARLWSQGGHRRFGGRGPWAEPWWGSDGQTICSCQMLFYANVLPSPSFISPNSPPSPQKTSDLCKSHDPTWTGQGGHVPTRGYVTDGHN